MPTGHIPLAFLCCNDYSALGNSQRKVAARIRRTTTVPVPTNMAGTLPTISQMKEHTSAPIMDAQA